MILDPAYSVAHFPFYRRASGLPLRRAFLYLAYLGLLFATALTAVAHRKLQPLLRESVDWAAASIPPVTISGGRASSPAPGPVTLRHPRFPRAAFVVDTNRVAPPTLRELQDLRVYAYLTRDALYLLSAPDRLDAYPLAGSKGQEPVVLDGARLRKAAAFLRALLYPALWLGAFLLFFLWKSAAALLYSLPALLLNALLETRLDYQALFKLAVYAQTPVVLLQGAMLFLPKPIPYFGVLALLIVAAYLWQALRLHQEAGTNASA